MSLSRCTAARRSSPKGSSASPAARIFCRAAWNASSDAKFSTWDWIYGQSRVAQIVRSGRLACGTVEVQLSLDGGVIREAAFRGDFLGALPAQELADRLVGLRFERSALQQKLDAAEVNNYFDGVSSEVLLDLILGN